MPPALPTRIGALARDVTAFHQRLEKTASTATPDAPLTPDTPVVDRIFAQAKDLGARAESVAKAGGWKELPKADKGPAGDTVNAALHAARTAAQLLGTGPVNRAETTTSPTAPHSERSTDTWLAATQGKDLPNVRIVGSIPAPAARLVADRLENVPARAVEQLDAQGLRSTLFSGGLTDVQGFKRLKGVQPRGWPDGSTWDIVPGVGTDHGMAANPNRERKGSGHGEDSLSLHELGHVVDRAVAKPTDTRVAESDAWLRGPQREVRRRGAADDYFTKYPAEWYAEAFMKYSRTPQTHASLARWYPETFRFLERTLGPARFD